MVQDRFQVEVRVMTAGKVLKIDVGEGAGDGMQVDDVADHEAVMPAGRLDKPHAIPCGLEGKLDMLGDLRQRGVIPGGEVQILRGRCEISCALNAYPPASSSPYRSKTGSPSSSTCMWTGGSPSKLTGKPSSSAAAPTPGGRADPAAAAIEATC